MSSEEDGRVPLTRRSLLKTGAAGAVAAGVGGAAITPERSSAASADDAAETAYGNCWMCHKLCGMEVTLNQDGQAQEIHGIDGHPRGSAGPGTNGTLCPKGLSQLEKAYSPRRIKEPHVRKNGELQAVSWDEAFSYAAEQLESVDPEKMVHFEGWGTAGGLYEGFLSHIVGVPNHMPHPTATCFGSMAVPGTLMGLGGGNIRWVDYQNTKYVLVWGRDPLETFSGQWEAKQLLDAKDRGAKIVTIDPSYSETAKKSDKWLPVEPRTDGALALAMANVIIEKGLYDEDFVENYTYGFDSYKAAVEGKTPEWYANEVQDGDAISPSDIREVATGFANAAPAAGINSWTGLGQSPDFFKGAQNVVALTGLVGNIDRPGGQRWWGGASLGNAFKERGISLPSNEEGNKPVIAGKGAPGATKIGKPVQNKVPELIQNGDITALTSYYRNPVTDGAGDEWIEALDSLDLNIVIDAFWSEMSRKADVVLPEASQLEKAMLGAGGHGAYNNRGWITGSKAAIEPQWNTKSGYNIVKGLAEAMGYGEKYPWADEEEYYDDKLASVGLSLDDLEAEDTYVIKGSYGYEKWKKGGFANGSDKFWFDLDKKAKIYDGLLSTVAGETIDTAPQWIEPGTLGSSVDDEYPLNMFDTRTAQFSHGGDQALDKPLEQLAEKFGLEHEDYRGNYLVINPKDAADRGIETGDMVTIESPSGEDECMAKVSEGIVPGAVEVTPYGFGVGSVQPDEEGANNMKLNAPGQFDKASGQIDRQLAVEVSPSGGEN